MLRGAWGLILVAAGICLVIVGCGGGGTEAPPSGGDYQGNYYGRYIGTAAGGLMVQVTSNGGFSAVYVGPDGCGLARGAVEVNGQLVVSEVQPEGVEFAGHITAFGGAGSITLLNNKTGSWSLAKSGKRAPEADEYWAGNMFGDSEGMIVGRTTTNDTASFIFAGTEVMGQVEGAVDLSGHVVAATTNYKAGMDGMIQGQSMTGVWYHVDDELAGTFTVARAQDPPEIEVEEGEDPPEDKIWLGETAGDGLTVCLSISMTGQGSAKAFVVNPEGGVGGAGNAVGDGRYAVVSYDSDACMWGTAFNSTGEGSYSDKLNDRSGTYSFSEYEDELSGLRGTWSGSYDFAEGEEDSGTLDIIVNGARIVWSRITPPTEEDEEPEYFFMNGIIAEDGTFEATSDNGEFEFTGKFAGARGEGDWTRTADDEVTTGTWEATYSG